MTRQRYPETFKIEAVKQITERGRPLADFAYSGEVEQPFRPT
ncbi:transposase [Aeromonas hydrophila]